VQTYYEPKYVDFFPEGLDAHESPVNHNKLRIDGGNSPGRTVVIKLRCPQQEEDLQSNGSDVAALGKGKLAIGRRCVIHFRTARCPMPVLLRQTLSSSSCVLNCTREKLENVSHLQTESEALRI
jgi:hypothetical protein